MSHLSFFTFLVFYFNFCLISVFSLYSLSDCGVTDKDCAALTSVLRANPSQPHRHLSLSDKNIRDPGVKLLSVVLEDPRCELETLW